MRDISNEQILNIVEAKGKFHVTCRYRDDWLRKRCRKLGLKESIKGAIYYYTKRL